MLLIFRVFEAGFSMRKKEFIKIFGIKFRELIK